MSIYCAVNFCKEFKDDEEAENFLDTLKKFLDKTVLFETDSCVREN